MKILFLPFYEANPYQSILKDKLEEEKEELEVVKGGPNSLKSLTNKFDVIHVHWAHFYYTESGLKTLIRLLIFYTMLVIQKALSTKIVWTIHNKTNHKQNHRLIDSINRHLLSRISDDTIVWREDQKDYVRDRFNADIEKIHACPHGNFYPVIEDLEDPGREEIRSKLDLKEVNTIYIIFGMLRPYKQVLEFLNHFKKNSVEGEYLLVAGKALDDQYEKKIREIADSCDSIQTDIRFHSEQSLYEYVKFADWAILPYRKIFNSGSVIYTLSCGTKVIAPKKQAIKDFKNTNSILYEKCFKDGFKKSREKDNSSICSKTFQILENKHNWVNVKRKHLNIYKEMS